MDFNLPVIYIKTWAVTQVSAAVQSSEFEANVSVHGC